jgi:hypothetical protein
VDEGKRVVFSDARLLATDERFALNSDFHLVSSGLWQWVKSAGLERFKLLRKTDNWILRGAILSQGDQSEAEAQYEIVCDRAWHTRQARIAVRDAQGERELEILAEDGRWSENGRRNEAVTGCMDIDLGWTPSTNTLPIRRLSLDVGKASGALTAAWVSFPDLKLQPLPQEYLRIAERQYRYSSRGGNFVALLSVDEHGLVVDYEGFWQRVRAKH